MNWKPSPFKYDVVEFTWLDLLKLALGKAIKDSALVAVRKGVKHEFH
jgi:hypothetical protein